MRSAHLISNCDCSSYVCSCLLLGLSFFFFFFSSRRRHTRSDRDWSSDVCSSDLPTVLAVARMYPRKRLEDLLLAASILRGRIPGVQARIVGGGPEAIRLRALHHRLGLGDTVVFLGEIERMALAVA